jgi:hypothetical protein
VAACVHVHVIQHVYVDLNHHNVLPCHYVLIVCVCVCVVLAFDRCMAGPPPPFFPPHLLVDTSPCKLKYQPGQAEPQQLPGSVLALLAGGGSVERLGFQGQIQHAQGTMQVYPSSLLEVYPSNPASLQRKHHRLRNGGVRRVLGAPVPGIQGLAIGPWLHNNPHAQVWRPHAHFRQWDNVPLGVNIQQPMVLANQHIEALRNMMAPGNKPWGLVADALNVGDARHALDVMCCELWFATNPVQPNGQPLGTRYNHDPLLAWCRGLNTYPIHYQLHPFWGGVQKDGCATIHRGKSYNTLKINVWTLPPANGQPAPPAGHEGPWEYTVGLHRLLCWLVHGPPAGQMSKWHVHHVCKNKWCLDANHLQWMPAPQHCATAGQARVAEEARIVGLGFPFRGAQGKFVPLPPHPVGHVEPMPVAGARNKRPRLVADVWQQGMADVVQGGDKVMDAVVVKAASIVPRMLG